MLLGIKACTTRRSRSPADEVSIFTLMYIASILAAIDNRHPRGHSSATAQAAMAERSGAVSPSARRDATRYGSVEQGPAAQRSIPSQPAGGDGELQSLLTTEGDGASSQHPQATHNERNNSGNSVSEDGHAAWWGDAGLCRRPTLLVDWLDGDAKRGVRKDEGKERHISWSELFFDLIYVAGAAAATFACGPVVWRVLSWASVSSVVPSDRPPR